MFKRISFRLLLVLLLATGFLSACSSSGKLKKKCLDCPEFSQLPQEIPAVVVMNTNE